MNEKQQARAFSSRNDATLFNEEEELDDFELLERLETLREDMEDLTVTTLAEVIQRITELHKKLDQKQS